MADLVSAKDWTYLHSQDTRYMEREGRYIFQRIDREDVVVSVLKSDLLATGIDIVFGNVPHKVNLWHKIYVARGMENDREEAMKDSQQTQPSPEDPGSWVIKVAPDGDVVVLYNGQPIEGLTNVKVEWGDGKTFPSTPILHMSIRAPGLLSSNKKDEG